MINSYIYFLSILLFTSCSSMVDGFYDDLDKDNQKTISNNDKFDLYRKPYDQTNESSFNQTSNPLQNNDNNSRYSGTSTQTTQNLPPNVQRQYVPAQQSRKRYRAEDLLDNDTSGSIWAVAGKENFLFSTDTSKQRGDIVLINVFDKLKNEISLELKRAFPDPPKKDKEEEEEKPKENKEGEKKKVSSTPPSPQIPSQVPQAPQQEVIDKISAVVIEEINKNHLLVKGRKQVLFKNQKRTVEVHALVNRRDINDNDEISSKNILESTINVLR